MRKILRAHQDASRVGKRPPPLPSPLAKAKPGKRGRKPKKTLPLSPKRLVFIKKGDPDWHMFRALMHKVKENTDNALEELQNELLRLNGKMVSSDHPKGYREVANDGSVKYVNYYDMYCMDPQVLAKEMLAKEKEEKRLRRSLGT